MADNNRVLNFTEFAGKYNQQSEQDAAASYSEFSKASDNFQDGFDEDTYEEGQAGPNRPIASGEETTPLSPDSMPTPTQGMEAPHDESEEEEEADDSVGIDDLDDDEYEGGNPEEDEDEEEDEEDDEEDDANESVKFKKNRVILESFDEFEARGPIDFQSRGYDDVLDTIELEFDDNGQEHEDSDNEECFVTCKSCGSKKGVNAGEYPMGAENEANPDSWWQGVKMGMMCEGCM
jgi:hypothetical protein